MPASHGMHVELDVARAALLDVPAGHGVGFWSTASQKLPAGQSVHDVAPTVQALRAFAWAVDGDAGAPA